jgi:hypothetical protein
MAGPKQSPIARISHLSYDDNSQWVMPSGALKDFNYSKACPEFLSEI